MFTPHSKLTSRAADVVVVVIFLLLWAGYEFDGLRTFVLGHFWLMALLALLGVCLSAFSALSYWKRASAKRDASSQRQ